jgi:hypothetical protein
MINKKLKQDSCQSRLDRLDLFAADVPQLNFEGRHKVFTSVGIFMSLLVYMAVFVYAFVKFRDLYQKNDPIVNNDIEYGKFSDQGTGLKLADH